MKKFFLNKHHEKYFKHKLLEIISRGKRMKSNQKNVHAKQKRNEAIGFNVGRDMRWDIFLCG